MTKAKSIYLIDGSAMFYRAYFAFIRNPLINSKGENTSATYGLVNSLLKIIREENPDYLAIAFDTPKPTFRHKEYAEYKSTRAKMPEDLVDQLPRIHETVKAMNIPAFELEGYEADDVIGTLAKAAEKKGYNVWCVTGDKDFFQLVTDKVKIYTPKKPSEQPDRLGPDEVTAKFGVPPELVIDKLALMGDSSDNVPGVKGIGKKTADSLLEQFGSLEGVLENHESIKAKGVREKIASYIDDAILSKRLVTIDTKVPIKFDLKDIKRGPVDYEACKKLFVELEFTSLLKQMLPDSELIETPEAGSGEKLSYETVTTMVELTKLVTRLSKVKELAVDTETTSLNAIEAELVGVSLSDKAGQGWYIPVGHSGEGEKNLPLDKAIKPIKKLLENPKVQKIGQNIKYDLEVLHRYGIDITPVSFDTMLASYVIDSSTRPHSLDGLAFRHFDYQMQPISELIGSGKSQVSFATVPIDKASFYAVEDADYTYRLRGVLAPKIDETKTNKLYYNIEMPLIKVLAGMEETGVKVDEKYLAGLSADMEKRLEGLKEEIYKIAGGPFNINSTQQLSHILFDKLGLPTKGKTAKKTGFSTDVRVLEELAEIHEFPALIIESRQLSKLKSTYTDAIPKLINPRTGRVHTSFNQAVVPTGRLSSNDPNLQNIPIRTEEGRQIRKAFVPADKDHVLLAADYSQIELRIMAHLTEDKRLVAAFESGEDIHTRTAAEVYGVTPLEVTPELRRVAKTANFAVIYGVTAFGLAQQTDMTVGESQEFIDKYLNRYKGIKQFVEDMTAYARKHGFVTTLMGRRCPVGNINSDNRSARQFAERVAVNAPVQGSAADIIKIAMIKIHEKLKKMQSCMVLQVHDELVFDVQKDELEQVRKIVKQGMERATKLKVPLIADMGEGENWLECK